MSNWFHRNPIKATSKVTFNLGGIAESIEARSICSDAASLRSSLLKLLSEPSVGSGVLLSKTQQYISLLMGFVYPPENSQDKENKLRTNFVFKWTNSVGHRNAPPLVEEDVLFEVCSILFTVALHFTKHAAFKASKEDVSVAEAKDVHNSLLLSAGLWGLLRDQYIPNLLTAPIPGSDLHTDIMEAYIHQSTAEAQEVAIARAIEVTHTAELIASLAKHTASIFERAGLALKLCDMKLVRKWMVYFEFKQRVYETCAYVYFAEQLLKEEKVGDALAVLDEADKAYKQALKLGETYSRVEGVGLSAKPAKHYFFQRLGLLVTHTRAKVERENVLIFHQRKAAAAPDFSLKAEFGIAVPIKPELDFTPDARWKDAYMGFNQKRLLESILQQQSQAKDRKEKTDRDAPVEAIPEKPIFSTDKVPKNESGCTLS